METRLMQINETNFIDAFHLELADGQEHYVSSPVRSLAQAYVYYKQCTPFGIYHGDKMVGYVMPSWNCSANSTMRRIVAIRVETYRI